MNQLMKPVSEQERIISLDMMRGFAILGIFFVNMLSFHSPYPYIDPKEWLNGTADYAAYHFIDIFVQASFYTLFSLLFGYSLVIFREKTMMKGYSFGRLAVRRLSLLLIIGLIHAFLIWHGDILITYAIMGFLFLMFIKLRGKNLLLIGILLYVIPNILLALLLMAAEIYSPDGEISLYDPEHARASIQAYQNGSFSDILTQRFRDWYTANNLATLPFMLISIFPLFLIGGGAAKLRWLENLGKHRKTLHIITVLSILLGVCLKLVPFVFERNLATDYIQDIFGGPLLAIGFGLSIALLAEKKKAMKILQPLSYVGRLSMSNYILQSVVATFIFYHYGLGLYGHVSVFAGTIIVIIIYMLQIVISKFWLSRYYYGPVEWLWRSFTYKRKQSMKRGSELSIKNV